MSSLIEAIQHIHIIGERFEDITALVLKDHKRLEKIGGHLGHVAQSLDGAQHALDEGAGGSPASDVANANEAMALARQSLEEQEELHAKLTENDKLTLDVLGIDE